MEEETPQTILTVENDDDIRELLVTMVDALGYRCLQAENAREALAVLQENTVDLILLDIHMPGARGNQLLRFIRERGSQIPVIVVSGYLQKMVIKQVSEMGVKAVLSKPIQKKRLEEEIFKILGSP